MKIIQLLEAGFNIRSVKGLPVTNSRIKTEFGVVELLTPTHQNGEQRIISVPMDGHPDKYDIVATATVKVTEEMVSSMLLSNVMAVEKSNIVRRNERGQKFAEHNFGYPTDTQRTFKMPESAMKSLGESLTKQDMFL